MKQEFESLARIAQKGFEEQTKTFDQKLEEQTRMFDRKFDEQTDVFDFKFSELRKELKEDHEETNHRIDRLYELVDSFIHLHQKLDTELAALRGYCQRLEERIEQLEAQRV